MGVLVNYPQYYPELAGLSLEDIEKKAATKKAELDKKAATKEMPGGKKAKKQTVGVVVKTQKRQGRKMTTTVTGLETFGIKLDEAAKKFKKKFACGSAVQKAPGQPDCVEIQGDPDQDQFIAVLKSLSSDVDPKKITFKGPE